ncbi:FN5 protein, putative [Ixodes scapularis]|uniref:Single-pass membrane and coiled-coil domain-containing protein 4 homolog n=1 Tax=Ixodes scapularis TaxID=6945 RepID=Q4PM94_IXOSC|nr:FN5 protein [Ixodes scapularis]EEC06972.1 FN5 protein, putative [Ixodes scapularis]|eukprot:XP_002409346.1 FN5 protein, putative [Ixodes scapularis]
MAGRNKNKPRLSRKDKEERRKDINEVQEKMFSVVIPVVITFAIVIVVIVLLKTRPRTDF